MVAEPHTSKYPIFAVACDIVTLTLRAGQLCTLLVRRSGSVHTGRWALPGGFVRQDENLEQAAYRELWEEAALGRGDVHLEQLAAYGDVHRDPRDYRVVSVAWVALGADLPNPAPATDVDRAEWVPVEEALQRDLAFDHPQILRDGVERARSKLEYTTIATAFCPASFRIPDLRRVYEAVWGQKLDPRNFQRKALSAAGFIVESGETHHGRGRPSKLYRRGQAEFLTPPISR